MVGNISANTFSHVAMTYSEHSGMIVLYINGSLADSILSPSGSFCGYSGAQAMIGSDDSGADHHFRG